MTMTNLVLVAIGVLVVGRSLRNEEADRLDLIMLGVYGAFVMLVLHT